MQKITPTHGLSWYLKWAGSILIMSGIICRAAGVFPIYDLISSCIGTACLAYMSYLWHDRALLTLNSVASACLLIGILRSMVT